MQQSSLQDSVRDLIEEIKNSETDDREKEVDQVEDNLDKEDEPVHVVDHNDHVHTQASDFLDVEDKSKPLQSFASTSEGIEI